MPTTAELLALDADALRDPWPVLAGWRARGPVALAKTVLLDAATWSSDSVDGPRPPDYDRWIDEPSGEAPELRELLAVPLQTLLGLDAPDHTRLRRVLAPWFSAAAIARLAPLVDRLVLKLLEPVVSGEPVDFVAGYARVLPLHTVATLLGLPRERWDELAAVAGQASTSNPHLETKATLRRRLWAELELLRFFDRRLRAPEGDPDGLVTGLAAAVDAGRITQREAIGLCREVLVAGAESSANHLASALLLLARDGALTARVAADPEALAAFVEEALRLEPDRAAPRRHLAFSHGVHFCIGAPLVRLQSTTTFRRLLDRVERIELLADPDRLAYELSIQDRALRTLPVRLVDRARREE